MARILLIEPFYGGSHKQLIDLLFDEVPGCEVFTQTAKKWHWRARTSALYFSEIIPKSPTYDSVLNLTELVALRPDLNSLRKIIYFHENQLIYPVRKQQDRDFQYGYNQVLSCLVADVILFNSDFNRTSFLGNIKKYFKIMPDYRPKNVEQKIVQKCKTLYFPIKLLNNSIKNLSEDVQDDIKLPNPACYLSGSAPLKIAWPHRWEHDKNPGLFLDILKKLHFKSLDFEVYILGQSFSEIKDVSDCDKEILKDKIKHWGYVESKEEYYKILSKCDVVISTANHEFFGVAMIEAAHLGCFPLCPNNLVYPEIFISECLYKDEVDLLNRMESFCIDPNLIRNRNVMIDTQKFSWDSLKKEYLNYFCETIS